MNIDNRLDYNYSIDNNILDSVDEINALKYILLSKFYNLDIIKNGSFKLKSGVESSTYIDFRKLVIYPHFFNYIVKLIDGMYPSLFYNSVNYTNQRLMPIPFGGIPLGTYISYNKNIPSLIVREKPKAHGTCNIIEGVIDYENDEIIIIDGPYSYNKGVFEKLQLFYNEHNKPQELNDILTKFMLDTIFNIKIFVF